MFNQTGLVESMFYDMKLVTQYCLDRLDILLLIGTYHTLPVILIKKNIVSLRKQLLCNIFSDKFSIYI